MNFLSYSGTVTIRDWKYTKSVGMKIKFSWLVSAVTQVV